MACRPCEARALAALGGVRHPARPLGAVVTGVGAIDTLVTWGVRSLCGVGAAYLLAAPGIGPALAAAVGTACFVGATDELRELVQDNIGSFIDNKYISWMIKEATRFDIIKAEYRNIYGRDVPEQVRPLLEERARKLIAMSSIREVARSPDVSPAYLAGQLPVQTETILATFHRIAKRLPTDVELNALIAQGFVRADVRGLEEAIRAILATPLAEYRHTREVKSFTPGHGKIILLDKPASTGSGGGSGAVWAVAAGLGLAFLLRKR